MDAEIILGVSFVFILIAFIAGLFLFPRVFGISRDPHKDDEQKNKD